MGSDGSAAVLYSPRRARLLHVALWVAFVPSVLIAIGAVAQVVALDEGDGLPEAVGRAVVGLVLVALCVLALHRLAARDRSTRAACVLLGVALLVLTVPLLGLGAAFVLPLGGLALLVLALLPAKEAR